MQPAGLETTLHSTAKPIATDNGLTMPVSAPEKRPLADYPRPNENVSPASESPTMSNHARENGVTLGFPEPVMETVMEPLIEPPIEPLVEPVP